MFFSNKKKEKKEEAPKKRKKFSFKKAFLYTILAGFLIGGSGALYISSQWTKDMPELDLDVLQVPTNPSMILDKNGKVITEYSDSKNSEWASLKEIPKDLQNAIVATEDKRFYSHEGIDYIRLGRVILNRFRGGRAGASTITQQLVKNAFLTPEVTFKRKYQEMILAKKLEKVFSKDEILEAYLNIVYFGENNYGVKSAAKDYFGKPLDKLTTRESAMIAGLTNSPSAFNPRVNMYERKDMSKTNQRTNIVLFSMFVNGYLSEEEYKEALEESVFIVQERKGLSIYKYPHFIEYAMDDVIADIIKKRDLEYNSANIEKISAEIKTKGYKIYTSMDLEVQKTLQSVVKNWQDYPKLKSKDGAKAEVAAVILDNETGTIAAMVGSREEPIYRRSFNRATMSIAPIASIIKPLSVYIPAFEKGFSSGDIEYNFASPIPGYDKNVPYPGGKLEDSMQKPYTYKEAIALSLNVVPARILIRNVGVEKSVEFLKEVGVNEKFIQKSGVGLVLGTSGIDMLTMSGAYMTIPNQGEYISPPAYLKVLDKTGKVVISSEEMRKKKTVFNKKTAWMINDALLETVRSGTGKLAKLSKFESAGKTGTHEDRSVTFAGYTPYYTSCVWIGGDNYEPFDGDYSGGDTAAKLWRDYMEIIHQGKDPSKKINPSTPESLGIKEMNVELISGLLPNPKVQYQYGELSKGYFINGGPKEISNYYRSIKIDSFTGAVTNNDYGFFYKRMIVIPKDSPLYGIDDKVLRKRYPNIIHEENLRSYNDFGLTPAQVEAMLQKRAADEAARKKAEEEKKRQEEELKKKQEEEQRRLEEEKKRQEENPLVERIILDQQQEEELEDQILD